MTRRSGFTLIETVLALGIVAMMLTSLMSLLPFALDAVSRPQEQAAQQRICAHVQQGELSRLAKTKLVFDAHGCVLEADAPDAAYHVNLQSGDGVLLPSELPIRVATVVVEIEDLRASRTTHRTLLMPP